jgi:hypothetical protein
MNKQLSIYASPLPFSNKRVPVIAYEGSNIRQIIGEILPPGKYGDSIDAIVQINGETVPKMAWDFVKPKAGTLTNIRIIPQNGGGSGGKNPLVTILSIAVLIAAPYAGAALAMGSVGFAGITFASVATLSTIFTAGLGVVGMLLINALAPPPKPSNLGLTSDPTESPTQFIEGASNQLNPYGVVPVVLGTNRIFPPQAAKPFTESQDDAQYSRQLFTWGFGDKIVISELKIGETDISEFTDIELEHRLDGDLDDTTALYSNDVNQDNYNVLLQEVDGYTTRTTSVDVDEAIVDITFPQGLTQFNDSGNKVLDTVKLELQYALSGVSPQIWSPGITTFMDFSGASIPETAVTITNFREINNYVGYRKDLVVIDQFSGAISIVQGTAVSSTSDVDAPPLPANKIRLSTALIKTAKVVNTGVETTSIESYTDDRSPSLFGTTFETSSDFMVSTSGMDIVVADGSIRTNPFEITQAQAEALRRSARIIFPERGIYDLRIRRTTPDTNDQKIVDKVYLTAIKSVTHQAPVQISGINGTAMRIKGTDQLTGSVDEFNAVVSNVIPDFNPETGDWTPKITSNPASVYRYVLQGSANARALPDSKLIIADFEAWHILCTEQGYTYNRVIDYTTSVDEVLRDVAAAGSATPTIVDGKRTIAVDRIKEDIVQMFTPRNSWGYSGKMLYPELPHAFRTTFRNKEKGYNEDERVVYDDGYSEFGEVPDTIAATKFEGLELISCTNADLAFKTSRRHIAAVRLRPETHEWYADVEHLVALKGDRVLLEHDVPLVGIGEGRIKMVLTDGGSPEMVTGVVIDDIITVPFLSTYYARIRCKTGEFIYRPINAVVGDFNGFEFTEPFLLEDSPELNPNKGDMCYFVEAGGELDLIITKIEPGDDLSARMTGVNYAPEIFTAESATIPPFDSNITIPLQKIRPVAPVLIGQQSDETVMLRNSDGSFLTRAIFTLQNNNDGDVDVTVKIRRTGSTVFTNANVLEASPERVIITGLEDGKRYDIHIRYRRKNSTMVSLPLQMNNYLFVGTSGLPDDPTNFRITISDKTALFTWDADTKIDHGYTTMKFSASFDEPNYATAQIREEKIYETRVTLPFQAGTYYIKHVDLEGNESENPAIIITFNPGLVNNVVEIIHEEEDSPPFAGMKDNVKLDDDGVSIVLIDISLIGYYYFANEVNLDDLYTSFVSAQIKAGGATLDPGNNNLFDEDDIFQMDDVFGIGADGWKVQLEFRTISTDPDASPAVWGEWKEFIAGNIDFWDIQFRLRMESLAQNITPKVTILSVTVDMPDRIERGEDVTVPTGGLTVTYEPPFKKNPSVNLTTQDLQVGDRYDYISKTASGFTVKIYNTVSIGYVERVVDYIVSGYGRKLED